MFRMCRTGTLESSLLCRGSRAWVVCGGTMGALTKRPLTPASGRTEHKEAPLRRAHEVATGNPLTRRLMRRIRLSAVNYRNRFYLASEKLLAHLLEEERQRILIWGKPEWHDQ